MTAHLAIKEGVGQFIDAISQGYALSDSESQRGLVWGKRSVTHAFASIFDPILAKEFSEGSRGWEEMLYTQIKFPLIEYLAISNCRKVADQFKDAIFNLDLESGSAEAIKVGESFALLADVLYLINDEVGTDALRWCGFCFRRSKANRKYCDLHKPSADQGADNRYRRLTRATSNRPMKLIRSRWKKCRLIRLAIHEGLELVSSPEELCDGLLEPNYSRMSLPKQLLELTVMTMNAPWPEISACWDAAIQANFPLVASRLTKQAMDFSCWSDFVYQLRCDIQNQEEDILDPLWLLLEMTMAEQWFNCEKESVDERNGRRAVIIDLHKQGLSAKDIKARVNTSLTYIYRILQSIK